MCVGENVYTMFGVVSLARTANSGCSRVLVIRIRECRLIISLGGSRHGRNHRQIESDPSMLNLILTLICIKVYFCRSRLFIDNANAPRTFIYSHTLHQHKGKLPRDS